ncbi:uncharacterized protein C5orf34 homolog isoform X1 [Ochotona princeps]|uniref:uncharacterized protein C5orf34 homolog isoform X1 n=1 Tax=Ochotona princeps TaxID=9978 RepID=UPI0027150727|nr:uncharacterized protein C5orf34 homolog isoform X1 [Ochotona princeps]
MTTEVQMILYEDDSVQVQYVDGSRLQLSPCGSEFLFEKPPPVSAHPLEQPQRIRQRTHFVISTYREQLQRALEFRNSSATCLFLSENLIPSERKKRVLIDFSEVRWPHLDSDDGLICLESGAVKITSIDGHAALCLPRSQHEFTVHFLCKVSQKPASSAALLERNNQASEDKLIGKAGKICAYRSPSGQKLKNKENELYWQLMQCREPPEETGCRSEGQEELSPPGTKHKYTYTWVKQCWSVAACPEEWKYPLSLALRFHHKVSKMSNNEADFTETEIVPSDVSKEGEKEISILPKAVALSCPVPHLHRWNFGDSILQSEFDEEYSYPEPVKVFWCRGVTYRLTHKNGNSIEIYPGDGSIFKSEGTYFGSYYTYYCSHKGAEEREEKTYSVNNLPPDRPGSLFSVSSLINQATRILQHCARMRLSLSHNYHLCCWKMVPGMNDSSILPFLLKESLIPNVGRFLAYSDDKVHAIFLDGVTLTLSWNLSSSDDENEQVKQGLKLGWCKLTFPDGQHHLIQTEYPGPYERYVTAVTSWCRRLTQTSARELPTHTSSSVLEENWSVASELEKIRRFNFLVENSSVLNQISTKKNRQSSDHCKLSSETSPEEVHEKRVSVALKKTSQILQDIDFLLLNSKK